MKVLEKLAFTKTEYAEKQNTRPRTANPPSTKLPDKPYKRTPIKYPILFGLSFNLQRQINKKGKP